MRNRIVIQAIAFVFLMLPLFGQTANDKIRIEVAQDGLYEVTWNDLAPFLKKPALDSERMRVMRGNVEIPMAFRSLNDGRFDRSSAFTFYGEASRSHYSKLGVYRLEFKSARQRVRLHRARPTAETLEACLLRQEFEEDLVYDPMKTVRRDLLDLPRDQRAHWFWARIPPATNTPGVPSQNFHSFLLRPAPRPRSVDNYPAKVTIRLRAPASKSAQQEMTCELGGKVVGKKSWSGGNLREISFDVPASLIKTATVLTIRNTSKQATWRDVGNQVNPTRRNDILIDSILLQFKSLLTGPTTKQPQIIYDLQVPNASGPISMRFANIGGAKSRFYDVARRSWLDGAVVDCTPQESRRIIAVDTDGYLKAQKISPWSKRNLRLEQDGADWVCITLERFSSFMPLLAKHRQAQGLKTIVVTDREIYDSYNHGEFSPLAIQQFLASARATWTTKPKFVLLAGDADRDVNWKSQRAVLPTIETTTFYNGETGSDSAFLPEDSPEMSIGRFPARRDDEVLKMIHRTINYESTAHVGSWNKRLNFIASEGRFGPMIDTLMERYARRILTDVIPASYDVTMTYASRSSSYLYPPLEFNQKVIDRLNEGALVYTYMGHGYAQGFDRLRIGKKRFPILNLKDVSRVDVGETPPLMTIIACSTAHFDNPTRDSIGEELMRRPHGPLALIGATRISHPFPNSLLSKELLQGLFAAEELTIGQVLRRSQLAIIKNWQKDPMSKMAVGLVGKLDVNRLMRDHRDMYVLFGDPAARLRRPQQTITLEAVKSAQVGSELVVEGRLQGMAEGSVLVTVEAKRDRIVFPITRLNPKKKLAADEIKKNYEAANRKIIASTTTRISDGAFSATIQLPSHSPKGAFVIKAYLMSELNSYAGSRPLKLEAARKQ